VILIMIFLYKSYTFYFCRIPFYTGTLQKAAEYLHYLPLIWWCFDLLPALVNLPIRYV